MLSLLLLALLAVSVTLSCARTPSPHRRDAPASLYRTVLRSSRNPGSPAPLATMHPWSGSLDRRLQTPVNASVSSPSPSPAPASPFPVGEAIGIGFAAFFGTLLIIVLTFFMVRGVMRSAPLSSTSAASASAAEASNASASDSETDTDGSVEGAAPKHRRRHRSGRADDAADDGKVAAASAPAGVLGSSSEEDSDTSGTTDDSSGEETGSHAPEFGEDAVSPVAEAGAVQEMDVESEPAAAEDEPLGVQAFPAGASSRTGALSPPSSWDRQGRESVGNVQGLTDEGRSPAPVEATRRAGAVEAVIDAVNVAGESDAIASASRSGGVAGRATVPPPLPPPQAPRMADDGLHGPLYRTGRHRAPDEPGRGALRQSLESGRNGAGPSGRFEDHGALEDERWEQGSDVAVLMDEDEDEDEAEDQDPGAGPTQRHNAARPNLV